MIPALVSKCISCMERGYNSCMRTVNACILYGKDLILYNDKTDINVSCPPLYTFWVVRYVIATNRITRLQRRYKTFHKRYIKAQGRT